VGKDATKSSLKIVVDYANGSMAVVAPEIFKMLGIDVMEHNNDVLGNNINKGCGVTHPEYIKEYVSKTKADIGIAFDGDGDRVLFVDEEGELIDGDHILAILLLADQENIQTKAKNSAEVVSTIMANYGFEKYLESQKIKLIRTDVGDRNILAYMQESPSAKYGGEPSGHIIIRDHFLTGDGIFTALKILEYMLKSGKKASELNNLFRSFPTVKRNIRVQDKSIITNDGIADLIRKYENKLHNRGKVVVRPSGTEPVIRISAEGPSKEELQEIVDAIANAIS
jgi:phosphoglucosamine mutase